MSNLLRDIASDLDLDTAVLAGSKRNDLLPPRPEDKVSGELGKRFSENLKRRIATRAYEPSRALIVHVPKLGHTTRPAAMLSLEDRAVYEALVDYLRPRIEQSLVGPGIAMWPRAYPSATTKWTDFEHFPLRESINYVVKADITGFYEQISHNQLCDRLVRETGRRGHVEALGEFLNRVMRSDRGLPQGIDASDALATFYLGGVDQAMLRQSMIYARHGDDMRIGSPDYSNARRAIYGLEIEVRALGLSLNPKKSRILGVKTYRNHIVESEKKWAETRDQLLEKQIGELIRDSGKLETALSDAGLNQTAWDVFYHGTISIEAAIELLRPHLKPSDVAVAEEVFRDTIKRAPGEENELENEVFHQKLKTSLVRLAAAKSTAGITDAEKLLNRFPDKTELFASYLLSVSSVEPKIVTELTERVFLADYFRTGWERAWLIRVLNENAHLLRQNTLEHLMGISAEEGGDWIARLEALKVLGICGELTWDLVSRIWNLCPMPLKGDVIAAVAGMEKHADWAPTFLEGIKSDPVHIVIIRHLANE